MRCWIALCCKGFPFFCSRSVFFVLLHVCNDDVFVFFQTSSMSGKKKPGKLTSICDSCIRKQMPGFAVCCNLKLHLCLVHAEIAQVLRAHSSTGPEQLNLENNQLILVLSKNPSGWWLGELQVSVVLLIAEDRQWVLSTVANIRGSLIQFISSHLLPLTSL